MGKDAWWTGLEGGTAGVCDPGCCCVAGTDFREVEFLGGDKGARIGQL